MTTDKRMLLDRVIKEVSSKANMRFDAGQTVVITVPNFNVGDSEIWVLVEDEQKSSDPIGFVTSVQLCTNPKNEPVLGTGLVIHDIEREKYGIQTDTVQKIRGNALKTFRYRVRDSR